MSTYATGLWLRDGRPLPDLKDAADTRSDEDAKREEPWRVWLHNDDRTPMEYVVSILHELFDTSWWKATRMMLTAHIWGQAMVGHYPKDEAKKRVEAAHVRARSDGWPLRLSAEPA